MRGSIVNVACERETPSAPRDREPMKRIPARCGRKRAARPNMRAPSWPPTGGKPRENAMRKAHSLIDKVYDPHNLERAWKRVRRNRGAHGVDQVTLHMFESDLERNLRAIERQLREQRYQPQPVRRVYIPKRSQPGKLRPLGIPRPGSQTPCSVRGRWAEKLEVEVEAGVLQSRGRR